MTAVDKINDLYTQAGSWRAASRKIGIPAGTLSSYVKGRPIVNKKHRLILGEPVLEPAPVCPVCGIVHLGNCPASRKRRRRRDLFSIPTEELREMIQNREEI